MNAGQPNIWPYRIAEFAGLIAVIYGLSENNWWVALAGGAVVLLSYAAYKNRHGKRPTDDGRSGDSGFYYDNSDRRGDRDDQADSDSGGGDGGDGGGGD